MERLAQSEDISIQPAASDDIASVEAVRYAVWRATYPKIAPDYISEADVDIIFADNSAGIERGKAALDNPDVHIAVAKQNDAVQGFVVAKKLNDQLGEILSIYVLEEAQGVGIGGKLFTDALTWLEPEQRAIRLETIESNENAINMYKQFGFEYSREIPPEIPDPPLKFIPHIEMLRQPASIE